MEEKMQEAFTDINKTTAAVALLEQAVFSTPWTEEMVFSTLQQSYNYVLLVTEDGSISLFEGAGGTNGDSHLPEFDRCGSGEEEACGYLLYSLVAGEAELLRLGVKTEFRGKGYGNRLMKVWTGLMTGQAERIFLEVRAGNEAAVGLYRKYGFQELARRKAYYKDPIEDACIMQRAL